MKIQSECVSCILNQSRRVAEAIGADEVLSEKIYAKALEMSQTFSFELSPPEVATPLYEQMALIADKKDLYDEVKKASTQKALRFVPLLQERLKNAKEPLLMATKIAVAGNVIDLAAEVEFDLSEELEKVFHTPFAINDFALLKAALEGAETLLYLADNAGEHIFDKIYIQAIKKLFPKLEITYMTRGNPIINDVTFEEAQAAGFESLCRLESSGVNTPGFVYERATKQAQLLFESADVIIAKGMGNYECLSESGRANLFFLLKIKCQVVARSLGKELGNIVCKHCD